MGFSTKPELLATKTPTEIDVAWAAGIYEGEGHCRSRRKSSLCVSIVQKDPEILHKLRSMFGGKVRFAHCATVPEERQVFVLEICGDSARMFLARVFKYLSSRRRAQVAVTDAFRFLDGQWPDNMSLYQVEHWLKEFNVSRYKRGTTPEEIREYKNKQRNLRRARQRGESISVTERVN